MQDLRDLRPARRSTSSASARGTQRCPVPSPPTAPALVVVDRLDSPEPVPHVGAPGHPRTVARRAAADVPCCRGWLPPRSTACSTGRWSGSRTRPSSTGTSWPPSAARARAGLCRPADQSWRPGVGAVAAAVVDTNARPVGALSSRSPSNASTTPGHGSSGSYAAASDRVSAALRDTGRGRTGVHRVGPVPGGYVADMPDITELILSDHEWFRRQFAALDALRARHVS